MLTTAAAASLVVARMLSSRSCIKMTGSDSMVRCSPWGMSALKIIRNEEVMKLWRNRDFLFAVLLLTVVWGVGCVSQEEYDRIGTELRACQSQVDHWRGLQQECTRRFDERFSKFIQNSDSELYDIQKNLEAQIQEIGLRDPGLKKEVQAIMDAAVLRFEGVNRKMEEDLERANVQLRAAEEQRDRIQQQMAQQARDLQAQIRELRDSLQRPAQEHEAGIDAEFASGIPGIVARIQEYDKTRLHCVNRRECPQRLTLSKKEIADISTFHGELTRELSALQRELAGRSAMQ